LVNWGKDNNFQMFRKISSSNKRLNIIHRGITITDLVLAKKESGCPSGQILVLVESLFNLEFVSET